ncbi:heme exporter protein CcmB [Nocardia sp. NRRL S-836]|uniref:heme exporter protein CcmB n=1 Tax=Nocardia sp. NRRL S-836 TaxID=1519492 RepID=UPI0006B01E04|nr:heme exporter protein CcmB [Nocardia sp. NRRL S-836]KOV86331.1 hypothetical protein ADL03_09325 [Nocardia sp. NRRL S-836]
MARRGPGPGRGRVLMARVAAMAAVVAKDLRVEVRARHAAAVVIPFVATLVVAFGLAMGPDATALRGAAPGLVWVAGLFGTVLTSRRSYEAEFADDAFTGLVLSPVDRGGLFAGKATALAVQLLVLQVGVLLTVGLLYGAGQAVSLPALVAVVVLGVCGLAGLGALLGVVAGASRGREALLPLLVFPLAVPLLVAASRATGAALEGRGAEVTGWLGLLLAYDVAFWSVGLLFYEHMVED